MPDAGDQELEREATAIARIVAGHRLDSFTGHIASGDDPSQLAWPPTLPIELALKIGTAREICDSHGIDRDQWEAIRTNPHFIAELGRTVEALRTEGMAFKARSQLQAVELLKTSWNLIHAADTPPNVKADMIKATIRWSGLDASKDATLAGVAGKAGGGFQINIMLG